MAQEPERQTALGDVAARQLANATKTLPQLSRITPRWLTHLLQWVPVESGIYRVNRVKDEAKVEVDCSDRDERVLPQTFVDYEEDPREYHLSQIQTILNTHTRVTDLYSNKIDQLREQIRLTVTAVREREEWEIINNPHFGLLRVRVEGYVVVNVRLGERGKAKSRQPKISGHGIPTRREWDRGPGLFG